MTAKPTGYAENLIVLPVLLFMFVGVSIVWRVYSIDRLALHFDVVLLLCSMVLLERIYPYRSAVSQKSLLARDIIISLINVYLTGLVAGMILLPVFRFLPEYFFGRKLVFASPEQLGPFWLQVIVSLLAISFGRYWLHRLQHEVSFLWRFHAYHHRVTDIQALNGPVSHPVDFAIRHMLVFVPISVVGFTPSALLVSVPIAFVTATLSHWSADVRGGVFNYLLSTPEVHRWHHAVEIPQGHKILGQLRRRVHVLGSNIRYIPFAVQGRHC